MIQHSAIYQELLAACEANPDDALPKMVVADWLDDHGEPELAYAYRWCASEGKWPDCDSKYNGHEVHWWEIDAHWRALPNRISVTIYLDLSHHRNMRAAYHSAHDAIADLARVLKIRGEKPEPQNYSSRYIESGVI